jgi:hypothetical protein
LQLLLKNLVGFFFLTICCNSLQTPPPSLLYSKLQAFLLQNFLSFLPEFLESPNNRQLGLSHATPVPGDHLCWPQHCTGHQVSLLTLWEASKNPQPLVDAEERLFNV